MSFHANFFLLVCYTTDNYRPETSRPANQFLYSRDVFFMARKELSREAKIHAMEYDNIRYSVVGTKLPREKADQFRTLCKDQEISVSAALSQYVRAAIQAGTLDIIRDDIPGAKNTDQENETPGTVDLPTANDTPGTVYRRPGSDTPGTVD